MKHTPPIYCVMDYETRSEADLTLVGAYEYARHPSTEILCVGYRTGTLAELPAAKTKVWSPAFGPPPRELFGALYTGDIIAAHNAFFEQVITRFVLSRYFEKTDRPMSALVLTNLPPKKFLCTASLAAVLALPRKLEGATSALKLTHQKDMGGHKLMMKMSKPRKATKNNSAKWHCKRSELDRLIEYCVKDVDAEVELLLTLPPLTPFERKVWELNQRTNWRGFAVDRPAIEKIIGDIKTELAAYDDEIHRITGGVVSSANKIKVVGEFLRNSCGLQIENLQAKTVQDTLKLPDLDPIARRVLEIRASASKTSTAKYISAEARSRSDGRVRDNQMYHGASTGRDTGTGLQIHNFPRGTLVNGDGAPLDTIEAIARITEMDIETIRLVYGDPMEAFSSILRSTIKATDGYEIFCGDWAAIEVRKLFWLAEHRDGVDAYRKDRKIYEEMAQVVFGVRKLEDVTKPQREVGKRIILGCGFGMGWNKFMETCEQYGTPIDAALAKKSVYAYRDLHSLVPIMWKNLENAAINAALNPGRVFTTNRTRWSFSDNILWCQLPSGRKLAYYGARVRNEKKPWGEIGPTLFHWGVHPDTKKWVFESTYGGRLAENVTQASARDIMVTSALRLDAHGYIMLFSVHDELANEKEIGKGSLEEYTRLQSIAPDWCKDLPIKVETWKKPRYKK